MAWDDYCQECGGTGEEFDKEKDDWTTPVKTCKKCQGSGYAHNDEPSTEG